MATHESSDVLLKETRMWKWGSHPLDTTVESSFVAAAPETPDNQALPNPHNGERSMLYRLHTLDVDPNNEINDEWSTSDLVWLPDHNPTIDDLRRELVNLERMAEDWPADDIKMEEDGDDILVCHKDGRKGYKLVPEKDDNDESPYMLTITTAGHKSHIPFSSLTHWRSFVSFILSIGQDGDEMRKRLEEGLNEEHGNLGL